MNFGRNWESGGIEVEAEIEGDRAGGPEGLDLDLDLDLQRLCRWPSTFSLELDRSCGEKKDLRFES